MIVGHRIISPRERLTDGESSPLADVGGGGLVGDSDQAIGVILVDADGIVNAAVG